MVGSRGTIHSWTWRRRRTLLTKTCSLNSTMFGVVKVPATILWAPGKSGPKWLLSPNSPLGVGVPFGGLFWSSYDWFFQILQAHQRSWRLSFSSTRILAKYIQLTLSYFIVTYVLLMSIPNHESCNIPLEYVCWNRKHDYIKTPYGLQNVLPYGLQDINNMLKFLLCI